MRRVLHHPFVRKHGSKFLRFLVAGGSGFAVDAGTLLILRHFGWEAQYALVVSGALSLLVVFLINKYFTFQDRRPGQHGAQAAKFLVVYGCSAVANYLLSLGFITVGMPDFVAKALATALLLFANYAFLRGFVFRGAASLRDS